jgi:hypothetical protein
MRIGGVDNPSHLLEDSIGDERVANSVFARFALDRSTKLVSRDTTPQLAVVFCVEVRESLDLTSGIEILSDDGATLRGRLAVDVDGDERASDFAWPAERINRAEELIGVAGRGYDIVRISLAGDKPGVVIVRDQSRVLIPVVGNGVRIDCDRSRLSESRIAIDERGLVATRISRRDAIAVRAARQIS